MAKKAFEFVADILQGIAQVSNEVQKVERSFNTEPKDGATYGDVVKAVTKNVKDSFWKSRILDRIPQNADSAMYEAAIGICEDVNMDDFWKSRSLEKVFKRS